MKDSKQRLYPGELGVLVGQLWQGDAPAVSFVCASGPNKSLARNLREAQAVGKECPFALLWLTAPVLISHQRGWMGRGPPGPRRADSNSLPPDLTCLNKIY